MASDQHLLVHLAVDGLQALFEGAGEISMQKLLCAYTFAPSRKRSHPGCATGSVECSVLYRRVQSLLRVCIDVCRSTSMFDDNLATHFRVYVAEVINDASVRRISHFLSDRQLCSVTGASISSLCNPVGTRQEEFRLCTQIRSKRHRHNYTILTERAVACEFHGLI